jgi:hypothetical protein
MRKGMVKARYSKGVERGNCLRGYRAVEFLCFSTSSHHLMFRALLDGGRSLEPCWSEEYPVKPIPVFLVIYQHHHHHVQTIRREWGRRRRRRSVGGVEDGGWWM